MIKKKMRAVKKNRPYFLNLRAKLIKVGLFYSKNYISRKINLKFNAANTFKK